MEEQLCNLIAKCPVLEKLVLDRCDEIENINISSHSVRFLSLRYCGGLKDVKIDAPVLTKFEYVGVEDNVPSLVFSNEDYGKRKSNITLFWDNQKVTPLFLEIYDFLDLSEFLMAFKSTDGIYLTIRSSDISFNNIIMNDLRAESTIIPEFEEVHINATVGSISLASYSSLMEGLLWSFSPKVLVLECILDEGHADFIHFLCEELLLVEDVNQNSFTSPPSPSWRNYFTKAKFEDRDDEWRPLHTWKSLEDVFKNLEDPYTLKLSHV